MKSLGIKGASVTFPYKIDVIRFLDAIDPDAADIGAVNTLVNSEEIITGYNTDGYGAVRALENKKITVENTSILILGNGGSARAIALTLLQKGSSVFLAGRNASRIESLARDFKKKHRPIHSLLIGDLDRKLMETIDIIINTTPVGMSPDIDVMPLREDLVMQRHTVFDIVYTPLMTKLLTVAREKKCTLVNGIDMLLFQGVRQFELWTGIPAPVDAISSAIIKHVHG